MLKVSKLLVIMVAASVMAGGCATHSQNKKTAAARWDKMSSQMKLVVAQQQFDNGKYTDAGKTVGECLKADPNMPQARVLVGKILFAQGQSSAAVVEFEKGVKLDEKLDDGWYWLGLAYEEQNQVDKADECYQKALDLNGSNIEYILAVSRASVTLNKTDAAIALLKNKMGLFPSDVELKAKYADLQCRRQQYDDAISFYRQAVMLSPQRDDIAESFGYCCVLAGQWTDASEVFAKLSTSCADESKKSVYLQLLGMCQVNAGQYGSAMNSYSKINTKERDTAQIWLRMGQAALGVGDAERAYTCSRRALAIQPNFTDAIAIKGSAEYLKKDYADAVKSFEQIVHDPKHQAFGWTMLSKCYEHLGDSDKARQAAQKAGVLSKHSEVSDLLAKHDDK